MRGAQPVQMGRRGWAVHRRLARPRVLGAPAAPVQRVQSRAGAGGCGAPVCRAGGASPGRAVLRGVLSPPQGGQGACPSRDTLSVMGLHVRAHTQRSHALMITLTPIHNCTQIHRHAPTHTLTAVPSCTHLTFTHSRLQSHPLSQVHKQPHIRIHITHLNPTHLTHSHEHLHDSHCHVITYSVTHPH